MPFYNSTTLRLPRYCSLPQNKVNSVTFHCGRSTDALNKRRQRDVEPRFTGWVVCRLIDPAASRVLRLELKGPDNSLRVRQVKILGSVDGASLSLATPPNALVMQQQNCEAETLKVFRLLTSQVCAGRSAADVTDTLYNFQRF